MPRRASASPGNRTQDLLFPFRVVDRPRVLFREVAWVYPKTIQDRCSTTEPERRKLLVGIEPTIFRLRPQEEPEVEGGRVIHCATGAREWALRPT